MNPQAFELLRSRLPSKMPVGRKRAFDRIAKAANDLREAVQAISANNDLSTAGKAKQIAPLLRAAGAALAAGRRQADFAKAARLKQQTTNRAVAIGEAKSTDGEYRAYLRSLPAGERLQVVFKDQEALGAALRLPALSGLNAEQLAHAQQVASIGVVAPDRDADEMDAAHFAAVQILFHDLQRLPALESNGQLVPFGSEGALQQFLGTLPAPNADVLGAERQEIENKDKE